MREPLRIYVQVWCEIDPTLAIHIDRATSEVRADEGDQLVRISPAGRVGIDAAMKLRRAGGGECHGQLACPCDPAIRHWRTSPQWHPAPVGEVVAFAVGGGHDAALRHALAAGAKRAIELVTFDPADDLADAALAAWLAAAAPDLVIAGIRAGAIAAKLQWAHLAGVTDLEIATEDEAPPTGRLRAIRHLGRGQRERVSALLPASIRLACDSAQPSYVSRARVNNTPSHRIERVTVASATISHDTLRSEPGTHAGPLEISRPRTHRGTAVAPASGRGLDRLQALVRWPAGGTPSAAVGLSAGGASDPQTPEQMADEFVRYLKHHRLLPESKSEGPD